jgi:hypothetical protein
MRLATQNATIGVRLAELETRFLSRDLHSMEWLRLAYAFKEILESDIEVRAGELRQQLDKTVDAFLDSLKFNIESVNPMFGSMGFWIDDTEKAFQRLRLGDVESDHIKEIRTKYASLLRP